MVILKKYSAYKKIVTVLFNLITNAVSVSVFNYYYFKLKAGGVCYVLRLYVDFNGIY